MILRALTISLFLSLVLQTSAQTNFYSRVSEMWLNGQKPEVRDIGNQRLQSDSNDIAGLILKLEYEVAFLDFTNMPITAFQVLERGATISSTNFVSEYRHYKLTYQMMLSVLTNYPEENIEADRAKASITNKSMSFGPLLHALQEDGYFH